MAELPHDLTDLRLAPVALAVDRRIDHLARLAPHELAFQVAVASDLADWTREMREEALLRTVRSGIDLHGWEVAFIDRGIQLSHGPHRVVLGVPESFASYLAGAGSGSEPFERSLLA